jgi:hypothetical protein
MMTISNYSASNNYVHLEQDFFARRNDTGSQMCTILWRSQTHDFRAKAFRTKFVHVVIKGTVATFGIHELNLAGWWLMCVRCLLAIRHEISPVWMRDEPAH